MLQYPVKFWRPFDNLSKYLRVRDFYYSGWDRYIFFAHGEFDNWAAYVCKHDVDGVLRCALPDDISYFELVVGLANYFGGDRIYAEMFSVYERVRPNYDSSVLSYIEVLAAQYGNYQDVVHHVYAWLYYAMVAEENKANTHLGGSIKMLALHRILHEGMTIENAEMECTGVGWLCVRERCESVGIHWHGWQYWL